jgi:choline dehydrogenase-like flavoprotein
VVNPDLTVRGVARLRVVDSSVFPDMLSARGRPLLALANV